MQLKTMTITGFKSFPEAKLDFPTGITAVVGPNGSGKSNVVDAILWVLGEQSTKALRSEKMEDVIFNGTESKKPMGMAEVSLVVTSVTSQELEAISGIIDDVPGTKELMITRRLYRDGESEYLINKLPCRLKDIRSLFLEARAGTKGHTVIEQGNIDQILSGTPQDRRNFIEETAGIGRFKKQKNEALRKLTTTQQNLLRVRDIISEVRKQLRMLERQARQAEEYTTLRNESRALEIQLLSQEYQKYLQQRTQLESELGKFEALESQLMAEEARQSAVHQGLNASVVSDGEVVGRTQETLRQLEHDMGQTLTVIEVERNRLQTFAQQEGQAVVDRASLKEDSQRVITTMETLQDQLDEGAGEVDQRQQRVNTLEEEERTLNSRRSRVQTETEQARQRSLDLAVGRFRAENLLQSLEHQRDESQEQIQQLQDDLVTGRDEREIAIESVENQTLRLQRFRDDCGLHRNSRDEVDRLIQQLDASIREKETTLVESKTKQASVESRLRVLHAVLQEEFGYGRENEPGLPALRDVCQGVKGAVAERLDVSQDLEKAIEAALGEYLRSWVVDGIDETIQSLTYFRDHKLGRAAFVSARPDGGKALRVPGWWEALSQEAGVMGRAIELIGIPNDMRLGVERLLWRVVIVQTFDQAIAIFRQNPWSQVLGPVLVTLDGEVIDTVGVVSGGSIGDSVGLLQRRREVQTLEEQLLNLSNSLETLQGEHADLIREFQAAKEDLQRLENLLREAEMQVLIGEKEVTNSQQLAEQAEEKLEDLKAELESELQKLKRVEEDLVTGRHELDHVDQEQASQKEVLENFSQQLQEIEATVTAVYGQLTDARLALAACHERRERAQADLTRMRDEEHARQERVHLLEDLLQSLQVKTQESQTTQAEAESRFKEVEQTKLTMQTQLQEVEERHTEGMMKARALDQEIGIVRKKFATTREERGETEIQLAEIRTRVQSIEETLVGTYAQSLESLPAQPNSESMVADSQEEAGTPAVWRERLQVIRQRLERLGPLNLAAIEEHKELEERYHFLTKQEEDLSESIGSLQEIIERLNGTTNHMFQETFQALQEKFGEVFSALFAGGHAELVLTERDPNKEGEDFGEEPGVDIVAQPPGKRLKNLSMLSGGEKALTVLALLFGSFLIKPSPFCILDEVDASLDEPNVIRFARFLTQLTSLSQFLIITHNKRTMEIADTLFGVTMEEPGVSKFVSVRLAELETV
ncbi:MAG: chromosome segregation protein SMC [Nitrospirota bacterium]|nr:chromosome segregation protein SMC [Nitrospirota bacterium]